MRQGEWEEFIFFLFAIYIVLAIWGIQMSEQTADLLAGFLFGIGMGIIVGYYLL